MKRSLAVLTLSTLPFAASAHPHIFIDAGISFIFNDAGALSAVKVEWAYDDLYTLVMLDDYGLDVDGDGKITVKEQEKLVGFDMQWLDGFEGDLYVTFAGKKIALGQPIKPTAVLSDGRLVTSHIRKFKKPVNMAGGSIALKVFDPTYYSAYTLDLGAEVINRDSCMMEQISADLGKAYDVVENLLYGSGTEDDFPAVGENFADTLTLSCETSS
jgi:ABC-type uncharacterized transport system substrate-binding protein